MPIVVATAPAPPPPAALHVPLTHVWRGADSSVFTLTDMAGKVVKVRGASGFGAVPVEHWWNDSPAMAGSFWNGSHDARAELFVPIEVWGTDSNDFIARHRQVAQSFGAVDAEGEYWVYTPDGAARRTLCRYSEGLETPIDLDPVAGCRVRYGITMARANPYWLGPLTSYTFTGSAIPVSQVLARTVSNPGDVPAWPRWTVNGPWSTVTVGVVDADNQARQIALLSSTVNTSSGGRIIETDPRADVVAVTSLTGADRWADVVSRQFGQIQPGQSAQILLGVTGSTSATSVKVEFTPAYRMAW